MRTKLIREMSREELKRFITAPTEPQRFSGGLDASFISEVKKGVESAVAGLRREIREVRARRRTLGY